VFIQDRRNKDEISTYISEIGELAEKDGESYLLLLKGSTQRPRGSGDSSIITFDDYAIDLSQFMHKGDSVKRPRERDTWDVLFGHDAIPPQIAGLMRAELYDRFTSPLYAFAAGLIGFAALGEARTTRQGRGWSIGVAILTFGAVRMLGIAVSLLLRGRPGVEPPWWVPAGAWTIPLISAAAGLDVTFGGPLSLAVGALRRSVNWRQFGRFGRLMRRGL
jgi:lipopolysaccharide export system permease protein